MNRKGIFWKIIMISAWTLVISGLVVLLVAANRRESTHVCRDVSINLKGSGEKFYIETEDVLQMIQRNGSLKGREIKRVNLSGMEKVLMTNPWIKDAELYFDNRDVLHVWVEEREPIARVFTTGGYSFYIDSSGYRLPLLRKMSIRLPVVTGFVHGGEWNRRDSSLMQEVKEVAGYIYRNEFWNAQVGQIDITPARDFELIPVIGDHIIRIGNGEKVKDKLGRLYVFYKQVLSKTGFNKYAVLDLRFDGQVVAQNRGPVNPVDSIQLKQNIEELMNRASLQQLDEDMLPARSAGTTVADSTLNHNRGNN